jgi:cytochrome c-type biogenesis protein CcmH/NrfG
MLGRSYIVLKNTEGAKRAFAKAIALKPDELTPKAQMIALLWGETPLDAAPELPGELVAAARDALRVDPNNPEGLLVEGLAAAKTGDTDTAKRKWRQAEAAAPKDGPLAGEIARRLASLP